MEDVLRDVRHGVRGLLRSPLHTAVTVLTLALGIGSAVAVFTLAYGVLLRPLPYGSPERLVTMYEARPAGGVRNPSYPSFEDWNAELTAFEALTFIRGDEFRLRGEDGTQRLLAGYVSDDFFRTMETSPVLGRVFDGSEDAHVVVLSHRLWQRRFGGDASIIGRSITTTEASFTVIGVMPAGFRIPSYADVWAPIRTLPQDARFALTRRDLHVDAEVWGLIRDDVTAEQAQQDAARVVGRLAAAYPDLSGEWSSAVLTPVRDRVVGEGAVHQLRILIAAVALVLLIVCVNVAGLQLARGSTRTREFAVRAALGAGRGRLVRQLLTETLLLAVAGGALGVLAAMFAIDGLSAAFPNALPRLDEVGLDERALAFAVLTAVLAAAVSGIVPALRSSSPRLTPALRDGAGTGVTGGTARIRSGLVVVQVALAIVLTVGSGLLLRSLRSLQDVDPGFDSSNVVALRVFPPARYADEAAAAELYRRLHDATRRVAGVADVALTNHLPLAGGWMVTRVLTSESAPESENAVIRTVSGEYFDVLRSRLLEGRLLQPSDFAGAGGGAVINRALARQFFPDGNAVGRAITVFHSAQGRENFGTPIQAQVVGVIADEHIFDLASAPPPIVYVPNTWMVWGNITLAARTNIPASSVIPALRRAVQGVERDIPVAGPSQQAEWRPLDDFIGNSLEARRLLTGLITSFAAAALLLALLGIFGMTAYLVARRTREIGIRVAIGAPRRSLVRMVLGHALRLTLLGVAIGVPAAWAAARLLESQLFAVSGTDPLTAAAAALTFIAAAAAAAFIPTVRALRVPPAEALRSD